MRTYGKLVFNRANNGWLMQDVPPHVCIVLKSLFPKIKKYAVPPFTFENNVTNALDLLWFCKRYPMEISKGDMRLLNSLEKEHHAKVELTNAIFSSDYTPSPVVLREGKNARNYQLQAKEFHDQVQRFLLGDDVGLGKTLSSILTLLGKGRLPAAIVVQTHLPIQWKEEIEKFTNLTVHLIKNTTPYTLPPCDVFVFRYSQLSGWCNYFNEGYFKSCIFDEIQELRRKESLKHQAARVLSEKSTYCLGLSATPVFNYGAEIFNILDLIKPGCLGKFDDFLREWGIPKGNHWLIKDPGAFGAYLRDQHLFLRRTRADVGRELPPVNKIVHTVAYDEDLVKDTHDLAKMLAMKVMSSDSFMERGMAARELDMLVRQDTGISKAREVALYVRILLESDIPVLLAGWHRRVYEIWLEELKEFNPVMYTGSENTKQKNQAKEDFISGKTNLMIISLRSGVGLDGLQKRCSTVVIGELDWSPQVPVQLIGRVHRDGVENQVTAIYLVSQYGSDPVVIDLLGLKNSQADGIINPFSAPPAQFSDETRIKALAQAILTKKQSELAA